MNESFEQRHKEQIAALDPLSGEILLDALFDLAKLAESEKDTDAVAQWHENVINAASRLNRFDYELKSFHEVRRLYASGPQYDHLREMLLWYFKWVMDRLPEHVDIPRDLMETMYDQMQQFYSKEHESLRPIYALRALAESFMGRTESAADYFDLWQSTPAGKSDDCEACETHAIVQYFLSIDKPDDAIKAAEPILRGKLYCDEVPANTFSRLLIPLLQRQEVELAEALRLAVVRQVRSWPKLMNYLANHIVFLCLTGRSIHAKRLASVMLGRGILAYNSYDRYASWRAGWIWLTFLSFDGCARTILPRAFAPESAGVPVETLAAAKRCRSEAISLAMKFDERNGTSRFMDGVNGLDEFLTSLKHQSGSN